MRTARDSRGDLSLFILHSGINYNRIGTYLSKPETWKSKRDFKEWMRHVSCINNEYLNSEVRSIRPKAINTTILIQRGRSELLIKWKVSDRGIFLSMHEHKRNVIVRGALEHCTYLPNAPAFFRDGVRPSEHSKQGASIIVIYAILFVV